MATAEEEPEAGATATAASVLATAAALAEEAMAWALPVACMAGVGMGTAILEAGWEGASSLRHETQDDTRCTASLPTHRRSRPPT